MKTGSPLSSSSWCVRQASRLCGGELDANRCATKQNNHEHTANGLKENEALRCSTDSTDFGCQQHQLRLATVRISDASGADGARAATASRVQIGATTKVSPRRRPSTCLNDERDHSLLEWPYERKLMISPQEHYAMRETMADRLLPAATVGSPNPSQHDGRDSSRRRCRRHLSLAADYRWPRANSASEAHSFVRERKRVIKRETEPAWVANSAIAVAVEANNRNDHDDDDENYACQASGAGRTAGHAREELAPHMGLDLTTRRRWLRSVGRRERPPERHLPAEPAAARSGFVISIISEREHAAQESSIAVVAGPCDLRVINRHGLNDGHDQHHDHHQHHSATAERRASGGQPKVLISRTGRRRPRGPSLGGARSCWLALYALLALNSLMFTPQTFVSHREPYLTTSSHSHNFLAFNFKSVHCQAPPPAGPPPTDGDTGQRESSKFAFWLELERPLFEGSGAPAEAVAQLARTLADWPDQRQAALFYLEQVAERVASSSSTPLSGPTGLCPPGKPPISLAQLMRPSEQWAPAAQQAVALDDLAAASTGSDQRELNDYLTLSGGRSSRLAQLAVDNANLIGRLLAMGERRELNSSGTWSDHGDDNEDDDETTATTETPNFLSKLFRFKRSQTSTTGEESPLNAIELGRLEMVLRRLVTPKFVDYLLEFKAREWLTSNNNNNDNKQQLLHSVGMVMFNEDEIGRPSPGAIRFGSLALVGRGQSATSTDRRAPPVLLIQSLYSAQANSSIEPEQQQQQLSHLPSYLAKWLRRRQETTDHLTDRLGQRDLDRKDGGWFSPQLECGQASPGGQAQAPRWLLTYSIPVYSRAAGPRERRPSLRGVSFVSLDLARMGPLISQCTTPTASKATEDDQDHQHHRPGGSKRIPSFLAGTHHCQRIRSSQCVPLPEYFTQQADRDGDDDGALPPLRPGAYVCKCPTSWPQVAQEEREATRVHREQLIELLVSRAALNSSLYALDQLAIERVTGSLHWQQDGSGGDGSGQQQQRRSRQPQGQLVGGTTTTTTTRMTGAFELTNKAAIARLLLLTRATSGRTGHDDEPLAGQEGPGAHRRAGGNATESRVAGGQFTLGAQLEAEAALDWFARSGSDTPAESLGAWPEEACQRCGGDQPQARASSPRATDGAQVAGTPSVQSLACLRPPLSSTEGALTSIARGGGSLMSRWLRPLVLIAQLVCLALTLALAGCLVRLRKSRTILLSGGWPMLATMLLGALLLYASVLVRYFQATSLTCLLEPWLRELGFSTFYGSLLIKLYRILTEFQTRKAHRVCLRDKDQIVYLLAIVFIVIGYMSAWTALMVDGFFVRHQPSDFGAEDAPQLSQPARLAVRSAASDGLGVAAAGQRFLIGASEVNQADDDDGQTKTRHESQFGAGGGSAVAGEELWRKPAAETNSHLAATGADVANAAMASSDDATPASQHRRPPRQPPPLMGPATNGAEMGQIVGVDDSTTSSIGLGAAENLLNEHLEILERGLNSFGELFLGLLESEPKFEPESDTFVYLIRCRKLAWDYVTESSELALLLFGVHLVYKLRNASSELHKEKLILSLAVYIELVISSLVYLARHALWHSLTSDHLLVMYFARCQLTVTLTVILVFAPKLRQVCRNKPSLLLGAFSGGPSKRFSALLRGGGGGGGDNASSGCHAPSTSAEGGSKATGGRGASVRHRCHISCELHDHHLNDASRLQQAMLSNSALEIGTINLADMDPDEIQAELKRVYTQLELLKTKVMRRDNPHISKRRGGRKPGHRKFSLQAFHGRHSSSGGEHHPSMAGAGGADLQASETSGAPATRPQQPGASARARLPALAELEGESSVSPAAGPQRVAGTVKHVRVNESLNSQQDDESNSYAPTCESAAPAHHHHLPSAPIKQLKKYRQLLFSHSNGNRKSTATNSNSSARPVFSSTSGSHQNGSSTQVNQTTGAAGEKAAANRKPNKWAPEMPSTSSLGGYMDDDVLMMTMNDSQSSGELTPQHRSSIAYSQSSFQQQHVHVHHHQHHLSQPTASTSTNEHLE